MASDVAVNPKLQGCSPVGGGGGLLLCTSCNFSHSRGMEEGHTAVELLADGPRRQFIILSGECRVRVSLTE